MNFEDDRSLEKLGEKIGYIFSYFMFTTILFFILEFLNKLPIDWSYFHMMGITFSIALTGTILKRLLK